jgi:hypothetical protein
MAVSVLRRRTRPKECSSGRFLRVIRSRSRSVQACLRDGERAHQERYMDIASTTSPNGTYTIIGCTCNSSYV